jgi:hypothetical protein
LIRLLLVLLILAMAPFQLTAQTLSDAENKVRLALDKVNRGGYSGITVKGLEILGDESAVALTKILAGKTITNAEIQPIVLVITLSYSDPRLVENPDEREPRTTMFLLNHLNLVTTDARLRQKIADCRAFVTNQYALTKQK